MIRAPRGYRSKITPKKMDIEDYIDAHISEEPDYLNRIDRETNLRYVNGRMCSGHIQGRLLKMLTAMIKPERVLEIGTFTGYSALSIAEGLEPGAIIETIEIDDELEEQIIENFRSSPFAKNINLHIGDALEVMKKWEGETFDMVFIDGDKRLYKRYLEVVLPLTKPGGFILADNTLWDGHVIEESKHSSQTKGVMEFNDAVAADPALEVAIIPFRDGLTIIRKLM